MVETNLKAETMRLMKQRDLIEAEMNSIIQRLCQPGGAGLSGNLLDFEDFPRADIDVPTVRADRCCVAGLKNDYKDLTEKIDHNLQLLHAPKLVSKSSAPMDSETGKAMDSQTPFISNGCSSVSPGRAFGRNSAVLAAVDPEVKQPFAMVDEITEASPSAEDGLQLGDQIVKFGTVESGDNLLSRLASEAQTNVGRVISVMVMRQGALTNVSVTPRIWRGRGLLGCHFKIL